MFRSDATEGVWSPTQNVAVQTEANVASIFFFHQCGFYDPTHHIRGCQNIIWNFALKGRALVCTKFRSAAEVDQQLVYFKHVQAMVQELRQPFMVWGSYLRRKKQRPYC